jgi:hypothetical protein
MSLRGFLNWWRGPLPISGRPVVLLNGTDQVGRVHMHNMPRAGEFIQLPGGRNYIVLVVMWTAESDYADALISVKPYRV